MATTKTRNAALVKSPKKAATKAPVRKTAKPQPSKASALQAKRSKKPSPAPVRAVAKAVLKKTTSAPKPKDAKATTQRLAASKKDLSKKPVKTAPVIAQKLSHKPISKTAPKAETKTTSAADPKKPRFNKTDLEQFKNELLGLRDRINGQSGSMRNDALKRTDEINPEEDGTDAFMRLQTLEQVSSQHQIIANIDESLRAIEKGSYGICDMCGELINKQRLAVVPFAKNCIKCQSEMERPRRSVGRR